MRFEYQNTDLVGFVEKTSDWFDGTKSAVITKFCQALPAVRGVTKVMKHPKGDKVFQNHKGDHYQDHNFVVSTERIKDDRIEFELIRHNHMTCRVGLLQATEEAVHPGGLADLDRCMPGERSSAKSGGPELQEGSEDDRFRRRVRWRC